MAGQTVETLADIQSMIDIMSERLVALRSLRLQKLIKDEIRSLEGKLLRQFWEQLKVKSQNLDKKNISSEPYPSLSTWLLVVGVSDAAKEKILGKLSSMESWLSLSDNEVSKFLDGLPDDKEDVRKVCVAHSFLRGYNTNKKDADGIFWDSWKKGTNENGYESNDNASGVDHNENVRNSSKPETTTPPSDSHSGNTSAGNQSSCDSKFQRVTPDNSQTGSLLNLDLSNNSDTGSLDRTQTLPHTSTSNDSNSRMVKSHSRQSSGHLLQKPKVSTSLSSIGPSQLNSSVEKISTGPRKIKKRPGSIELRDTALPDFADMMRPNSATATRKASQTTPTSYDSSCGSPMSPRTPLTPVTPHMFAPYRDVTDHHASHHAKSSRFKGLRAIKDKIKGKMGISNKLRRNKSEEHLDEAGNEKRYHKTRSDTCPDTTTLITGVENNDTVPCFSLLNSALVANNLSRPNIECLPDSNFQDQLLKSYRHSREDLTSDLNDYPTRSNSSDDAAVTADESEENEEFDQKKIRGIMRQSSAVNEEWDVPWDELVFQERIGEGRVGTVYRGKWHGEVAIRAIDVCHNDERKLRAFKEEVTLYKKTRHDNIELFMGSSMNLTKLAIITSYCRGKSLYQYIRSSRDHVSLNNAKIIAQHIAQGMGYLHSRGIVHKDLKSKNVFIDGKRVTITDFGILGLHTISSKSIPIKPATLQIPDGWLCYMAPEIIRALRVPDPKSLAPPLPYTKESDMYAFGTVWYELLTSSWPFQGYCAESIIWQVGNGRKQSLSNFQGSKEVKDILMACWARDPLQRQEFSDSGVMGQLLRLPQTKIYRRSSQPIKSNKKGNKHSGIGTNDRMFDLSLHSVIHELAE